MLTGDKGTQEGERERAYAVWGNMTRIERHETIRGREYGTNVEMPGVSWCSIGWDHPLAATLLPPEETGRSARLGSVRFASIQLGARFSPFSILIYNQISFITLRYILPYSNPYLSRDFYSLLLVINTNIREIFESIANWFYEIIFQRFDCYIFCID